MPEIGLIYLNIHGKVLGPLSVEVVRSKLSRGELRPGTRWSIDRSAWRDMSLLPSMVVTQTNSASRVPSLQAESPQVHPPADLDLPPPIPAKPWLSKVIATTMGLLVAACVLVIGTLFLARPELFSRVKEAEPVAITAAADNLWGADNPAPKPEPNQQDKKEPINNNEVKEQVKPKLENPPEIQPKVEKPVPELKVEDVVRKCEPSVAVLKNAKGSGSGFLIDKNLVATNQHVVGNVGDLVIIRFPSADGLKDKEFKGNVVRTNEIHDLALVRIQNAPGPQGLELGDEKSLQKGQDIVVIGSPGLGDAGVIENAVRKGTYSTTKEVPPFGEVLELGVAINPGNSGGPVFDMTGKVVGVAVAKGAMVEAVGFAVPISQLRLMMRKQRIGAP